MEGRERIRGIVIRMMKRRWMFVERRGEWLRGRGWIMEGRGERREILEVLGSMVDNEDSGDRSVGVGIERMYMYRV